MKKFLLMTAAVLITACQGGIGGDEEALEVAERWGEAWFNCDYHDAANYCTPESEQWLRMAASNTTDEELQLLRDTESGAQADADDYFTIANDTLRIVTLHVSHALTLPALGKKASLLDDAEYHITVVKRNGQWKVRMEGLPRSEKQNHD